MNLGKRGLYIKIVEKKKIYNFMILSYLDPNVRFMLLDFEIQIQKV